jgi:1-aminocyclopropane-1-carboxylate deaminase
MNASALSSFLAPYIMPGFVLNSRIHPMHTYIKSPPGTLFIKREDELSSSIPGSKFRKFASLLSFLTKNPFDEVVLIGGANSNNILGALQLLKENSIPVSLFILESNQAEPVANELWIKMLLNDEKIRYLSRLEWPGADKMADKYKAAEGLKGRKIFILREGSAVVEAMPGAMTLASDIIENERGSGKTFRHIFIDSGTGASAIGLILALENMEGPERVVHVTLIAGKEAEFMERLDTLRGQANKYLNMPQDSVRMKLVFHKPASSVSFGSINNTVIKQTILIAKQEGLLMDPVYSVKHLMTIKNIIESQPPDGSSLIIYNGGSQGLMGYSDKLLKELKEVYHG